MIAMIAMIDRIAREIVDIAPPQLLKKFVKIERRPFYVLWRPVGGF